MHRNFIFTFVRIVAYDTDDPVIGAADKAGSIESNVQIGAARRPDGAVGRSHGHPLGNRADLHGQTVSHVGRVEGHLETIGPVTVLHTDSALAGWGSHRIVLVLDGPVGVDQGLEAVGTAALVVGNAFPLDDQPRTVVVVVDGSRVDHQIVPERGDEMIRRAARRQRLVTIGIAVVRQAYKSVRTDEKFGEIPTIEGEVESDGEWTNGFVVTTAHGHIADTGNIHPGEGRPEGIIAVNPAVAEIVRTAGSQGHRSALAVIHAALGDLNVFLHLDRGTQQHGCGNHEIERARAYVAQGQGLQRRAAGQQGVGQGHRVY